MQGIEAGTCTFFQLFIIQLHYVLLTENYRQNTELLE